MTILNVTAFYRWSRAGVGTETVQNTSLER